MKENKIEKLILDLSNRWDCSPQEAVDRLNSMNESEINKLINSMTKKFQMGGRAFGPKIPYGNYMIIGTKTEVLPKKSEVTQAQIDSAYNAEQDAFRKRAEQLIPELEQRNAETKQRLGNNQNWQTIKANSPVQMPVTNSDPQYFNGPRNFKFQTGGIMKCLQGGKTYSECKKCGGKTPIVKNQEPAGKMENTVLPRYAKIVEQGWNDPRYTFLSDINGGALSTVTPNNIHSYDGMMYATEQVANPWGQYVNQMNRMAGLPEEKRIYRKPDFRLMIQQNDLGQSVPIAYPMDFIDSKFDYNKATDELSEKQAKIRAQKKACGGPLPKKSKFKK